MALQANERSLGGGCGPTFPGTRALEGRPQENGRDARHYCGRPTVVETPHRHANDGGRGLQAVAGGVRSGGRLGSLQQSCRGEGPLCCAALGVCPWCPWCPWWEAWTRRAPSSAAAAAVAVAAPSNGTWTTADTYIQPAVPAPAHPKRCWHRAAAAEKRAPFVHRPPSTGAHRCRARADKAGLFGPRALPGPACCSAQYIHVHTYVCDVGVGEYIDIWSIVYLIA